MQHEFQNIGISLMPACSIPEQFGDSAAIGARLWRGYVP
jgi:hypothetical protein